MSKKDANGKAGILQAVERLHRLVDARAAALEARHAARLKCERGCHRCCVDDLTVFPVEALVIQTHHSGLLEDGTPSPTGGCAFLDETGACRIYQQRPYVCRTQGLPLRWLESDEDGNFEYRDICPLNETETPLETLAEDEFWTLGEFEGQLASIQAGMDVGMKRVALRSLFTKKAKGEWLV